MQPDIDVITPELRACRQGLELHHGEGPAEREAV
jgi:hypothetical protein